MACLIKAPQGDAKGVVSFTTPERDHLIRVFPDIAAAVRRLKPRYLTGLHHNWHDGQFLHDPLFDFNLAGEDDLAAADGKPFPLIPMDACNFSPPIFVPGGDKFWDVLFVARGVRFKGIPEFFRAIRALYDDGDFLRVLVLCPLPPPGTGTEEGVRALYESLFNAEERALLRFSRWIGTIHFRSICRPWRIFTAPRASSCIPRPMSAAAVSLPMLGPARYRWWEWLVLARSFPQPCGWRLIFLNARITRPFRMPSAQLWLLRPHSRISALSAGKSRPVRQRGSWRNFSAIWPVRARLGFHPLP